MYSLLCFYNPLLLFQLNNNKYILKIFVILFSTGKKKKVCNNTRGCKCWHFIVGWTVRVNRHIVACLWSWIYRDLLMLWPLAVHTSRWAFDIECIWCSETFFWCCTHTNPPTLVSRSNYECCMCHATLLSNRDVLDIFVCWGILSIDDAVVRLNAHCNFNQGIKINVVSGP